mgnify:CR=1 FL=1
MRLDEISHILDANNIQYIKIQNGIQENHANNEDYYELKNLKEKGYIYYMYKKKTIMSLKFFNVILQKQINFF